MQDFFTGIIVIIIILLYRYLEKSDANNLDRRFRVIENILGLIDYYNNPTEKEIITKPVSYKIEVTIMPHWEKIIHHITQTDYVNKKYGEKVDSKKIIDEIMNDIGVQVYNKDFRFVYFFNGISQIEQIWSDYHCTFVDEIKIKSGLLGWKAFGIELYPNRGVIGKDIYDEYMGDTLFNFPYKDIINLFISLYRHDGKQPFGKVLSFPSDLEKKFELNKITYECERGSVSNFKTEEELSADEKDLCENDSEWKKKNKILFAELNDFTAHIFNTEYCSIKLKMKVFE